MMRYRADIDGLRAVAVLGVVFFHAKFELLQGGFVGVDVFFVISGYLITALCRQRVAENSFSLSSFYAKRARRLFPALFATLLVTFLTGVLCLSADDLKHLGKSTAAGLLSISNFQYWSESGYFDTSSRRKPLLHTWSLAIEEQFYAVWPLLLVALLNRTRYTPHFIAVVAAGSLFLSELCIAHYPAAVFFLLPFRVYEFMMGAILPWIPALRSAIHREAVSIIGLVLILVPMFLFSNSTPFPGLCAAFPCLGTSLLIHAGPETLISSRLLASRLGVIVGRMSYSLYLVHWPLDVLYQYQTSTSSLQQSERWQLLVASLGFAALLFHRIEVPSRSPSSAMEKDRLAFANKADVQVKHERNYIIKFGALTLFILTIATHAWVTDGWLWRIPTIDLSPSLKAKSTSFEALLNQYRNHVRTKDQYGQINVCNPSPAVSRSLILGDSHADHLGPFGNFLGNRYGSIVDVWWLHACPPLFGLYRTYTARDNPRGSRRMQQRCRRLIARWRTMVIEAQYDYVFLASRWAWNVEEAEYGPWRIEGEYLVPEKIEKEKNIVRKKQNSRRLFEIGLRRTVRELTASGSTRVVIVSQSPPIGRSPSGCTNRPHWSAISRKMQNEDTFHGRSAFCVGATKQMVLERLNFTNSVIRQVASEFKNASALISSDYFCQNWNDDVEYCRVVWLGRLLYRDDNHLSEAGALYLAQHWDRKDTVYSKYQQRKGGAAKM